MSDNLPAKDSKSLFTKEEEEEAMWDCSDQLKDAMFCSDWLKDAMFSMKRDIHEKEVYKLYCDNQDFNEHTRFDIIFLALLDQSASRVINKVR